jgi:hypothetical protein
MACALASVRACDSGDICARNASNFLAIDQPFLSKLCQVVVVESVGDGDVHVVPTINAHDAGVLRDGRNQPVSVALDVENDATVTENAGIAKLRLDIGRGISSNSGLMRSPY